MINEERRALAWVAGYLDGLRDTGLTSFSPDEQEKIELIKRLGTDLLRQYLTLKKSVLDALDAEPDTAGVSDAADAYTEFKRLSVDLLNSAEPHKVNRLALEMLKRFYTAQGVALAADRLGLGELTTTKGTALAIFEDVFNNFEPFKDENNG